MLLTDNDRQKMRFPEETFTFEAGRRRKRSFMCSFKGGKQRGQSGERSLFLRDLKEKRAWTNRMAESLW